MLQSGDPVTFSPYTEAELVNILEARVGRSVFVSNVITLIAKKVATGSGDARKALEMLSDAAKYCLGNTEENVTTNGPIVTMAHVVHANRQVDINVKEKIEGLPVVLKVSLCVLTSLAHGNVKSTTIGVLRDFVAGCMHDNSHTDDEFVGVEDFAVLLETLVDTGLLVVSNNGGKCGLSKRSGNELFRQAIHLGLQLEEVSKVLEKDLKESFYQKIRENASRDRDCV